MPHTSMRQIAVVEDEEALAANYQMALERAGFRVVCYPDADIAMHAFQQALPDLALIDIGLGSDPDAGFELCRQLRGLSSTVPILFLTARDSELDVISGLRLGADDYLVKNISLQQLIVRIRALFRRLDALGPGSDAARQGSLKQGQAVYGTETASTTGTVIQTGGLLLDDNLLRATWQEQPVELTVTEFWIVFSLAARPGQVKSRQQLMEAANVFFDDQTVTAHIKRIRRKFESLDNGFDAIQTVYGMGYRWHPERV